METNEARPWFLKRWIVNPLTTIDSKIFDKHVTGPYLSSGLVVYSATITFIVVMGIALISTIWAKKSTQETVLGIGLSIVALYNIYCIVQLLRQNFTVMTATNVRVWRTLYVLFLVGAGTIVAIMLTNIVVFVLVGGLILWVVFQFISPGSGSSAKKDTFGRKTYKLPNGVTVTEETGILGEKSWHGSDGCNYELKGDCRFYKI